MTILERLEHFEKHQLDEGDEYGAEVLHDAARVIRELGGHIEDAKAWAEHAGMYLADGMPGNDPILERLRLAAFKSWSNLSPDAKELLE